ncbi:MAG: BON domain-containing protein, partial [Dokdonella sp.]
MKTDRQLQKDVAAEMTWDPFVEGTSVGIEVKEGIVTLSGHVESYAQKWAAERAAERVVGVRGLAVELDVILPGSSKRTDSDIARAA